MAHTFSGGAAMVIVSVADSVMARFLLHPAVGGAFGGHAPWLVRAMAGGPQAVAADAEPRHEDAQCQRVEPTLVQTDHAERRPGDGDDDLRAEATPHRRTDTDRSDGAGQQVQVG